MSAQPLDKASDQRNLPNPDLANPTHLSNRAFGIHLIPDNARRADDPVRKRQVIYIAGYDPRGPEEAARRILQRETDRMAARTGISASLTPVQPGRDFHEARWTMSAKAPSADTHLADDDRWSVETEVLYLRWDDLVAPDFARPYAKRAIRSLGVLVEYLLSGTLWRMARTCHTTLFLWLYPPLTLILLFVAALYVGGVVQQRSEALLDVSTGLAGAIGALMAIAVLSVGRFAMPYGYWGHLMELWIFCRDYACGLRPDIEKRIELFAERIAEAVSDPRYDETVIVGHSYGCMLAMEATGAALLSAPQAFREGSPVVLANVASCAGTSLLHETADDTRRRLRALSMTSDLIWLEIQGKQDLINYYRADPVEMAGIPDDPDRPNPVIRGLSHKELVTKQTYSRIRRDFFRNHHQTIMANDRDYPWEFPRIVVGPRPFASVAQKIVLKYLYWFGRTGEAAEVGSTRRSRGS